MTPGEELDVMEMWLQRPTAGRTIVTFICEADEKASLKHARLSEAIISMHKVVFDAE